jgi:hypothetical protein
MASDDFNWSAVCMGDDSRLSEEDKALRDTFVAEYLVDYSPVDAAIRCGFMASIAAEFGNKLLSETYVQRKLKQEQLATPAGKQEASDEEELHKRKILAALMREAHNHMISGAARVAALSRLAAIYKMDQPTKGDDVGLHRGGVMMVPAIASLDAWENAAVASQTQLVLEARS